MPPQYLLHIGQQKSGTTYLQTVLHDCGSERLRSIGLCYPLAPVADAPDNNQQYAMFGLLGEEFNWVSPEWQDIQRPAWDAVAAEARDWDGPVLLSAEALSVIRTEGIHRLLDAIGNPDDVTVIITTRDLGATIASSWQQHVRNGRTSTFEQYLEKLKHDRERFGDDLETELNMGFWRSYAVGGLARRWADVVGTDNVRVVTSPGKPIDLLWARFCEALGVPGLVDLPDGDTAGEAVHVSLTASEITVLREVNLELAQFGLTSSAAGQLRTLLIDNLRARPQRGPRITLPASYREIVAAWSNEDLAELDEVGVKIYGSLEDFRYEPKPSATAELSVAETAQAAGVAVAAMMRRTQRPRPAPAPKPFPVVMRGFLAKWKLDVKRWVLKKWRAVTMLIAILAVVRIPDGSGSDGAVAQLSVVDSIFGSVHDSVQFALSAGYG